MDIQLAAPKTSSTLRATVDLREAIQRNRIAFNNRIKAVDQGRDTVDDKSAEVLDRYLAKFQELEDQISDDIVDLSCDYPIIDQMIHVKGVGRVLAARLVSMIDITRAESISSLWRYCGYGVENGHRESPKAGEKLHYNKRAKVACYLIATSMLRSNSPYRWFYDNAREYYDQVHPDWTAGHKHAASMRKMVKMFLSHLWQQWRTLEGLPTRLPYPIEKLDHKTIYQPKEFGWPEIF